MNDQNKNVFQQKMFSFQSQSQQEQISLEKLVNDVIEIEYIQQKFSELNNPDKSQILSQVRVQFHQFVLNSYLIHRSQLSTVMIGQKNFISKECLDIVFQTQEQKQLFQEELQKERLIVLKNLNLAKLDICNKKLQKKKFNNIKLLVFEGFSLELIKNYFLNTYEISYCNIIDLINQLMLQLKKLHKNNIVHGDISCGNVLVRSKINFQHKVCSNIQVQKNKQGVSNYLKKQLQNVVERLFQINCQYSSIISNHLQDFQDFSGSNKLEGTFQTQNVAKNYSLSRANLQDCRRLEKKSNLVLSLIDFQNSFQSPLEKTLSDKLLILNVQKDQSQERKLQENNQLNDPTQTLLYRAPQAIYQKGGSEIDPWGVGHIIFVLLTGRHIFQHYNHQNQSQHSNNLVHYEEQYSQLELTQDELQKIFSNQSKFYAYLKTQIDKFRHLPINNIKDKSMHLKLVSVIESCLKVNPLQRIKINEIQSI